MTLLRFMSIFSLVVLTSCQSPMPDVLPLAGAPSYITMAVPALEVVVEDESGEDGSGSWVDVSLTQQAQRWFQSRYRPSMGEEKGTLVIRRVCFKESPLPKEGAMKAFLTNAPETDYQVVLEVRFEIRDQSGFAKQFASTVVRRNESVSRGISLSERQAQVQKLINATIEQADKELLESLQTFLPLLLVGSDAKVPH